MTGNDVALLVCVIWVYFTSTLAASMEGYEAEDAVLWPLYVARYCVLNIAVPFCFAGRVARRAWHIVTGVR